MVVYSNFSIHSILFCTFLSEIEILEIFTTQHGVMAVKRKTIHNFVWQKLVPTYRRDINKFPKILPQKVLPTYRRDVLIGEYIRYVIY